ncbi:MAG TPA: hypothetical protein DD727_03300 [Clostridiales bacterium]|nr:hypothetical protein [Clostridiales bacterium]
MRRKIAFSLCLIAVAAIMMNSALILSLVYRDFTGIFPGFWKLAPFLLLLFVAVFVLAGLLSRWLTRRIVDPINRMDLEHPMDNVLYDELSPLLIRLKHEGETLQGTIAALTARQQQLDSIIRNLAEGLILIDKNSSILAVNPSALTILSAREGEYQGRNILMLSRNIKLQKAAQDAQRGKRTDVILEVDSRGRIYELLASPVEKNGAVRGALLLILDITEKYNAEKMRREFSANVSHELKTPLTSISGIAELMKGGLVKPKDVPGFAEKIFDESQRLIALIGDVLKISRLDEGAETGSKESVDLLALSREVAGRLAELAEEKNVSVSVSGEPVILYGDRTSLEAMVFNLCDNAIKYNKKGGSVRITLRRSGGEAVLQVSDTGIGIPAQHQDRIFERFYRVDPSHSRQTGGTGLGLSIVKHTVQYYHGRIELESGENRGTIITITLPLGP